MTRIYVPTTVALLRQAAEGPGVVLGPDGAEAVGAHAVTPEVREWYREGDAEELEYAATLDAAQASLRLLALDPKAPRRRVVLAADVDDALVVRDHSARWRSAVIVAGGVPLGRVVSVHLDEDAAAGAVETAVDALEAADAGDEDAAFALDEAEGYDLLWYDITELPLVLALG